MLIAGHEFVTYADLGFTTNTLADEGRLLGIQRGRKGLEPPIDLNVTSTQVLLREYIISKSPVGVVIWPKPVIYEKVEPARVSFRQAYLRWLEYFAEESDLYPNKITPGGEIDGDKYLGADQLLDNIPGFMGFLLGSKFLTPTFRASNFATQEDSSAFNTGYIFGYRVGWMRDTGRFIRIQDVPSLV